MSQQNNNYQSIIGVIISGGRSDIANIDTVPWLCGGRNSKLIEDFYNGNPAFGTTVLRDIDVGMMPLIPNGTPRMTLPKLLIAAELVASLNLRRMPLPIVGDLVAETLYQFNSSLGAAHNGLFIQMRCEDITEGSEDMQTIFQPIKDGTTVKTVLKMGGIINSRIQYVITEGAADPVAADIDPEFGTLWKNTTSGAVFIAVNDGGVIKKVALV